MRCIVFVAIGMILLSCKKEFTSCDGYDQLIGKWESIDLENGVKDYVSFSEKGKFILTSSVGRSGFNENLSSCANKSGSLEFYNQIWDYILIQWYEGGASYTKQIRYSPNYDTILIKTAAYNHPNEEVSSFKHYIKL